MELWLLVKGEYSYFSISLKSSVAVFTKFAFKLKYLFVVIIMASVDR